MVYLGFVRSHHQQLKEPVPVPSGTLYFLLQSTLVVSEHDTMRPVLPDNVPCAEFGIAHNDAVSEAFAVQNLHAIAHVLFGQIALQLVHDMIRRDDRNKPVAFCSRLAQKMPVSVMEPVKDAEDHYLSHET